MNVLCILCIAHSYVTNSYVDDVDDYDSDENDDEDDDDDDDYDDDDATDYDDDHLLSALIGITRLASQAWWLQE